ncbi:DUF2924 domain-containing protein [Parasphingorhabdus litoris]|uniref:DUF2924 domain-containing protein n=1 Tax=Parasphingorhabdus litoris TaxID=394733 RepID=UPI001E44916F|nr:DUF2924 domain-containing protein [Parasphingorhabdus litoris]
MTVLDKQLAALKTMPPAQLRAMWQDVYRRPAPDVSPDLLRCRIAHRLQERTRGKLQLPTLREIDRITGQLIRSGRIGTRTQIALKVGTRLTRSWQGRNYHVLVCDEGFEYEGRQYNSLSQIAEEITGAH